MNPAPPLGWFSATSLVVASMIGAGVFTTSGFLLADLHSNAVVLAAWAVGGLIAIMGAMCYGALARRIPESGGEYTFLSRTLHPALGFVAGWISLLVGFSAPLALAAYGFGAYARDWLGGASIMVTGTVLIVAASMLHSLGVGLGARVQNLVVVLKIALIVLFLGLGMTRWPSLPPTQPAAVWVWQEFAASLVWVSFSYSGWNAAIYVAGEVKDSERNVPCAMAAGALVVTALYLGLNTVFVYSAPTNELTGKLEVGLLAGQALGGVGVSALVRIIVSLALMTSVSSLIMAGPRVYARAAADGYLPRQLAVKSGPPILCIWLQTVLALVMLWTSTYESLLTYIGFTLSLCTALSVVGMGKLKLQIGAAMRVPGWPLIPFLYLAFVAWMCVFSLIRKPMASLAGLATIAVGLVFWRLASAARKSSHVSSP